MVILHLPGLESGFEINFVAGCGLKFKLVFPDLYSYSTFMFSLLGGICVCARLLVLARPRTSLASFFGVFGWF